jgi:hypothetical protein
MRGNEEEETGRQDYLEWRAGGRADGLSLAMHNKRRLESQVFVSHYGERSFHWSVLAECK